MTKIILIEDIVTNALGWKDQIGKQLENIDGMDVEVWEVRTATLEKRINNDGNYYKLGLNEALQHLVSTDAEILVTDLKLADAITHPINIFAINRASGNEALQSLLKDDTLRLLIGGCLVIDGFLSAAGVGGRKVIVYTDYLGNAVREYFCQFYGDHVIVRDKGSPGEPSASIERLLNADDIEDRIWPNETRKWFHDDHNVMKHDPPTKAGARKDAKNEITIYLKKMLSISPPAAWFTDDEQFDCLYMDLKHLIGRNTIFEANDEGTVYDKYSTLTIGNVALLFAMVVGDKTAQDTSWLEKIDWVRNGVSEIEMLPRWKTNKDAKDTVRLLANQTTGLFKKLSFHKVTNQLLVSKVLLDNGSFSVYLNHDFSTPTRAGVNETPLISKVQQFLEIREDEPGDTYRAFRKYYLSACTTKRGFEPSSVIRLYVRNGDTSVFEIRAV